MNMHHVCACCSQRSEEAVRSPGTGVLNGCGPSCVPNHWAISPSLPPRVFCCVGNPQWGQLVWLSKYPRRSVRVGIGCILTDHPQALCGNQQIQSGAPGPSSLDWLSFAIVMTFCYVLWPGKMGERSQWVQAFSKWFGLGSWGMLRKSKNLEY